MKQKKNMWYVWLAIAAVATLLTGGRFSTAAAAWVGGVFFIRFMRDGKPGVRFLIVVAVSWVASMISWYGLQPMEGIAYALSMLVTAVIASVPLLADRVLHRHLPGWLGTLVFPSVSTAIEYGLISANPMGSFGAVAYTQFTVSPLLQFASVGGLTGLAFLIFWFPAIVNHVWERGWKPSRVLLATAGTVYAAVLVFGVVHMVSVDEAAETVQTSMIIRGASDANLRTVVASSNRVEAAAELLAGLEQRTIEEARAGSRIVAWPEGSVIASAQELPAIRSRLGDLSSDLGVYLVAPYLSLSGESYENGLDIYDPAGEIGLNHVKFGGNVFEGSTPGDGVLRHIDTEFGRISAAVCWDMDFPQVIQAAGRDSVNIMISPSAEWREIVPIHAQMAAFRGVENGMSTVHPASLGLSLATDRTGRVLGELNWFDSEQSVLRVDIPVGGARTIYGSVGEVFGPVSGALTLLLAFHGALSALFARRRSRVAAA